jgi:EpsD family peptidyl-prolyl cis-trans isomerase
MKRGLALALVITAGVTLAGCGRNKEPTGQVVATVGKDEITAIDLRNELSGLKTTDPKVRQAAERQALESIINRKILAHAAEEAKIDKSPEYAQQKERVDEALLVQTWRNKLASRVPPPSPEEVQNFINEHPDYYSAHKIFVLDQIRMPRPSDPKIVEQMRPLNTMADVEQLLVANKIPYGKGVTELDSLAVPPDLLTQIMKLPPNEVFVMPSGNLLLVSEIKETKVVPVTGAAATNHAKQVLTTTRTREAIARQFESTVRAARKDVKYSKAYEPPPASKAASAKAPAGKAAPAATPPAAAQQPAAK